MAFRTVCASCPQIPRPAASASIAAKVRRTFAKICSSIMAPTPNTFAFPARIVEKNLLEIPGSRAFPRRRHGRAAGLCSCVAFTK